MRHEALDRVQRSDEALRVFLGISSLLLTLVQFAGIRLFSISFLVVVISLGMLAWGIGHIIGDTQAGVLLKLISWLFWAIQTGILAIFAVWAPYQRLLGSQTVEPVTIILLMSLAALTWYLTKSLYSVRGPKSFLPLAVGLALSIVVGTELIY